MHNEAFQHRMTSLEMAEMRVGQSPTSYRHDRRISARPKISRMANERAAEFFASA
jgi:hypothetical protein